MDGKYSTLPVHIPDFYSESQWLKVCKNVLFNSLKLTVVSEPEDDEGECEDVGRAYVSIRDILQQERDLKEVDVDSEFSNIFFSLSLF